MAIYSNKIIRSASIVVGGVLLILALYYYSKQRVTYPTMPDTQSVATSTGTYPSPLDATYIINGEQIALVNGKAELEIAPGSASKLKVSVFGQPTYVDLDGDGQKDAVFFLTEDSGGSGTFFYVAAALNEGGKYKGLNAISLGDRISPQTIGGDTLGAGPVSVNYVTRKSDEPMSAQPSVGVTTYVAVRDGVLVEIDK